MHASAEAPRERERGLLSGVAAYAWWGVIPVYFKAAAAAPAVELLAHRIVWALALLLLLARWRGQWPELRRVLRPGIGLALLGASTVLIALNWLVYIWAVLNARVMEGSLGYFINPLVSVVLGVVVLKESLERPMRIAVAIAALGVVWFTVQVGQPPWVALTLAVSFGLYGLIRKLVPVGAVVGLSVETLLLSPLALGYLVWAHADGRLAFLSVSRWLDALLLAAGPVTAVPLLLFTAAARRLPLTTLGFLQYLAPSLQFLLAVAVYREPFTSGRAVAFALIWSALAIFVAHSLRRPRPR